MALLKKLLLFDLKLSQQLLLSSHSRWWKSLRVAAHLGDGQYVFGGLFIVYIIGWLAQDHFLQRVDLILALVVLMTFLVVTLIKFVVRRQRPRPPGEFVTFSHDKYSFPSGHSARMAALSLGTLFFYPIAGGVLMMITLGVALARVIVGVHYLSDVVVGLGTGMITALIGVVLSQYLILD